MTHDICRACETCKWCMEHGCIPIQEEAPKLPEPLTWPVLDKIELETPEKP